MYKNEWVIISRLDATDGEIAVHLPSDIVMAEQMKPVMVAIHFQKFKSIYDGNWCTNIVVRVNIIDEQNT